MVIAKCDRDATQVNSSAIQTGFLITGIVISQKKASVIAALAKGPATRDQREGRDQGHQNPEAFRISG